MSERLGNCIAAFDYFDKTLIVLSAIILSIISFVSVIGAPLGIAITSFSLLFSLTTGIIKKLLEISKNKNKKQNKIVMLAKSKLNSFENLISEALIDLEISHEEHKSIINDEENFRRLKEYIRMIKSNDKEDELSENNKSIKENNENV